MRKKFDQAWPVKKAGIGQDYADFSSPNKKKFFSTRMKIPPQWKHMKMGSTIPTSDFPYFWLSLFQKKIHAPIKKFQIQKLVGTKDQLVRSEVGFIFYSQQTFNRILQKRNSNFIVTEIEAVKSNNNDMVGLHQWWNMFKICLKTIKLWISYVQRKKVSNTKKVRSSRVVEQSVDQQDHIYQNNKKRMKYL